MLKFVMSDCETCALKVECSVCKLILCKPTEDNMAVCVSKVPWSMINGKPMCLDCFNAITKG